MKQRNAQKIWLAGFGLLLMVWVMGCAPAVVTPEAVAAALVNTNTSQGVNGLQQTQIIEARDNVNRFDVVLDVSYEAVQLNSLVQTSPALFEANLEHLYALNYDFKREDPATMQLSQKVAREDLPQTPQWALAFHPAVALNLSLNVNEGQVTLAGPLSGLSRLDSRVNSGELSGTLPASTLNGTLALQSGSSDLRLPAGSNVTWQTVNVQSGTATFRIHQAAVASFIDIQVQSGTVILELDKDTPFWIDVESVGAGMVEIAYPLRQVRQGERAGEGIWESATYHPERPGVIVRVSQIESGLLMIQ
jgi:hypothetical protein